MLGALRGLPDQCREAWTKASGLSLPAAYQNIDRIVVLGMGGSAIAGDLWRVLLQREADVPVFNVRQYDLPPFVDEQTLVIASPASAARRKRCSRPSGRRWQRLRPGSPSPQAASY
jgi:glucose/mannose-6-phosphate isomerase